jgi:hypothetical protein
MHQAHLLGLLQGESEGKGEIVKVMGVGYIRNIQIKIIVRKIQAVCNAIFCCLKENAQE